MRGEEDAPRERGVREGGGARASRWRRSRARDRTVLGERVRAPLVVHDVQERTRGHHGSVRAAHGARRALEAVKKI